MSSKLSGLLLVLLLAACGAQTETIDAAERAVPDFHLALMDGDFAGIYQRAAPDLQQSYDAADFVAHMQKQRVALGGVRGTERSKANVDGELVTLRYNTFYEKAQAEEEFVVRLAPGQPPRLAEYRLLKPQLE